MTIFVNFNLIDQSVIVLAVGKIGTKTNFPTFENPEIVEILIRRKFFFGMCDFELYFLSEIEKDLFSQIFEEEKMPENFFIWFFEEISFDFFW